MLRAQNTKYQCQRYNIASNIALPEGLRFLQTSIFFRFPRFSSISRHMCQSFLPSFAGSIEIVYNFELGIARILPQHFYCLFLGAENMGA